ncbi:MAG: hypothetical protein JXQ74_03905 [Alphaproteobacteria bacterium]|nr:hypothetical protein [Alphaproteobacteria bacterium]
MIFLPALPPFFALIFSLFPLYVWWAKLFDHRHLIAGISFLSLAGSFVFPTIPWITLCFGIVILFFPGKKVHHAHRAMQFSNRWIKFPLEAFALWIVYAFFRILPVKIASDLGGKLGRLIGKKVKKRTQLALKNLNHVFPEKKADHQRIVDDMWENFGRTVGEIPHLKQIAQNTTVKGLDILKALKGKPYIVAVGHFNSVGLVPYPPSLIDQKACLFIRTANNPLTAPFLEKIFGRALLSDLAFVSKGREGMLHAVKHLKENTPIAIASDLYIKGGENLMFLGKPAITSPVLVKLSEKFNCPIVAIQVVREKGLKHSVIIHEVPKKATTLQTMQCVNDLIGDWVKAHPAQWFWINNRWHQD